MRDDRKDERGKREGREEGGERETRRCTTRDSYTYIAMMKVVALMVGGGGDIDAGNGSDGIDVSGGGRNHGRKERTEMMIRRKKGRKGR
jgi:hypothetical protein